METALAPFIMTFEPPVALISRVSPLGLTVSFAPFSTCQGAAGDPGLTVASLVEPLTVPAKAGVLVKAGTNTTETTINGRQIYKLMAAKHLSPSLAITLVYFAALSAEMAKVTRVNLYKAKLHME